jgi:hypothetical protein
MSKAKRLFICLDNAGYEAGVDGDTCIVFRVLGRAEVDQFRGDHYLLLPKAGRVGVTRGR